MKNQSGEKNPFYGKRHTEETKQKMREAAKRRWQIKNGLLPMPTVPEKKPRMPAAPEKKPRGWFWKGRKHTEETRRKMSEANSGKSRVKRGSVHRCRTQEEGYRLLITAVIFSALKDNEASFFDTDTGKYFCDYIGVVPGKLIEEYSLHITQHSRQFAINQ